MAGAEVEAPNANRELDVAVDVVAAPKVEVLVAELPNLNVDGADVVAGAALPNPPKSGALSTAVFFGAVASGAEVLPKAKGEEDLFNDPSSVLANKEKPDGAAAVIFTSSAAALTLAVASGLDSELEMGVVGEDITDVDAEETEEAPKLVDVERLKMWDPKLGVDMGVVLPDGTPLTSGMIVVDNCAGAPKEKLSFLAGSELAPKLSAFGGATSFLSVSEVDSSALAED